MTINLIKYLIFIKNIMSINISNSLIPNSTTAVGITSSLKTMFITEGENLVT